MTSAIGYCVFETAIGACGLAWSEHGVVAFQLPESDASRTRARLLRRCPGAAEAPPPSAIAMAIADVRALLTGERCSLTHIVIDDRAISEFNRRVYAIAREIPPGSTMTYGEVAARLGDKSLARAVGQAMGENPTPVIMPCHRVLAAGRKTGGFSGSGGIDTKLRLLSIERAQPDGQGLFDDLPLAARKTAR